MGELAPFDVVNEPEYAIELAEQSAQSRLDPNHPRQTDAIRLLTRICLDFSKHQQLDIAFQLIRNACTIDLGPNKAKAVVAVCHDFIKRHNTQYPCLIANQLMTLKGKPKVATIREIGRLLKRYDHIEQCQQIAAGLMHRSEEYAHRAGMKLLQLEQESDIHVLPKHGYDLKHAPEAALTLALKCAKSSHDFYDPVHVQNIQTAQSIAIECVDSNAYKSALKIVARLISPSMTYLKSQAILSISTACIAHKKSQVCIKIAEKLVEVPKRPQLFCCQALIYRLIEYDLMTVARSLLQLLEQVKNDLAQDIVKEVNGFIATFHSERVQSVQKMTELTTPKTPLSTAQHVKVNVLDRQRQVSQSAPNTSDSDSDPIPDSTEQTVETSPISTQNNSDTSGASLIQTFQEQSIQFLKDNQVTNARQYLIISNKPQNRELPSYFITEFNLKSVIHVIKTRGVFETFEFQLKDAVLLLNEKPVSSKSKQYTIMIDHVKASFAAYQKNTAQFFRDSHGAV